jgi:tetratricopeptide (TPR) repeat protein
MKKGAAYFWLGWYLCHVPQDRVDPEIAVKLLDRAYVLNSDRKNEWNMGALGIAHYRAGHWKDAIDWIGRAIEMSRDGGINYYAFIMAMAHWQAGDKDQAQTCYEKTVAWMTRRVAEGKPPLQPAWCFYMEAAELMGLKAKLFDDEVPETSRQQPFQQSAPNQQKEQSKTKMERR